jgi:peroxiredoxin
VARNKWVQLFILIVIIVAGAVTIGANLSAAPNPDVGDKAPDFSLYGLDGEQYELQDYRGTYVVINFWGSFCEPCVREMPLIQNKYEQYKDQNLVVLGINLDESTVTINNFTRGMNLTFPILLDKNVVRKQYGVYEYPTTFFIDQQGIIRQKIVGEMNEGSLATHDIDIAIKRLLYG